MIRTSVASLGSSKGIAKKSFLLGRVHEKLRREVERMRLCDVLPVEWKKVPLDTRRPIRGGSILMQEIPEIGRHHQLVSHHLNCSLASYAEI